MTSLESWTLSEFTADARTYPTYRRGTGPGVVLVHELPGITPEVITFADEVVEAGFTVVMPHLFGTPGAAFNLHLGPWSRGIFLVLTAVVLRALWALYRRTRDRDNGRVLAIALLAAGAVGNALDRVRSPQGVVDWPDVGVGPHRWPTFNVADVAVTLGAALLFRALWREDRAAAPNGVSNAAPAAAAEAA